MFFVSVASKGFSQIVTLLFATLAGRSISVAAKGLTAIAGSAPTGSGQAHFAGAEAEGMNSDGRAAGSEDAGVADKGMRSFLRHGERLRQYNARGTGCQCLFSG